MGVSESPVTSKNGLDIFGSTSFANRNRASVQTYIDPPGAWRSSNEESIESTLDRGRTLYESQDLRRPRLETNVVRCSIRTEISGPSAGDVAPIFGRRPIRLVWLPFLGGSQMNIVLVEIASYEERIYI
jgi:hypothetical protein